LLPGAGEALRALQRRGLLLILVSNQSGIGRGLITAQEAQAVHRRLEEMLLEQGVRLTGAYYCPHAPDGGCDCRKPSPNMILRAAREFGIDRARSFMVGDKPTDVAAGRRAGCRNILVRGGTEPEMPSVEPDLVARGWSEILEWVLMTLGGCGDD
jgi:histidinol-phosphate phosphatase family protein